MDQEIEFDEENQQVLITDYNLLDPNGEPVVVVYTYEEWEQTQANINN